MIQISVNVKDGKIHEDISVQGVFDVKKLYKFIRDAQIKDGTWIIRLNDDYQIDEIITPSENITLEDIHNAACQASELNPDDVKRADTRKTEYVLARHLYFAAASILTKHSLKTIAGFYGQDHATAIHGKKTISNDMFTNNVATKFLLSAMEKNLNCEIINNIK